MPADKGTKAEDVNKDTSKNQTPDTDSNAANADEATQKLESVRAILTEKGIDFTPENTLEELEALVTESEKTPPSPPANETPAQKKAREKQEKANAKLAKAVKSSPGLEQIVDRRAARMQERADFLDRVNVFSTETTNWGPRFVVVEMSKADVKAFGPKIVKETKLPLGTRVDNKGRELDEDDILDKDGNIVTSE